ncbi:MAG TPA: cupin domain-containing protein [Actinomycetota bacterium]|jgi:quercetin dioxygenase-like cupin family protein
MAVERAVDHPTFELGGNTVTSLAAPSRGAHEAALFRIDVPPGGGLPAHHHDHLDVFTVESGGGAFHIDETSFELSVGDSVVVPTGAVHYLVAGPQGASVVVTMLANTKLIREDDGEVIVPPWVS